MTSPTVDETDLALAVHMASSVAPIAMKWFQSSKLDRRSKADGSPVTQADLEIEKALRNLIDEHDSSAAIVGEEGDDVRGTNGRTWYFDPIDGTRAFAKNVPLFSTLIALHDEHGPAVGVISLPALDSVMIAGRGRGCSKDGKQCTVSDVDSLSDATVTTWGYDVWPLDLIASIHRAGTGLRGWSDAYGWYLAASGDVEAVIDLGVKPWDLAPMEVIMAEAGGKFSDFAGTTTINTATAIGSNAALHSQFVELTKPFQR